jgi:hypothetical protein
VRNCYQLTEGSLALFGWKSQIGKVDLPTVSNFELRVLGPSSLSVTALDLSASGPALSTLCCKVMILGCQDTWFLVV